jgi:hypothetical protein
MDNDKYTGTDALSDLGYAVGAVLAFGMFGFLIGYIFGSLK